MPDLEERGRLDSTMNIAVVIPCFNEELTIADVIQQFRDQLPAARICVFDNGSTDHTVECARAAGADVRYEGRRGKGYVVQSMSATSTLMFT
jgi:glycosyltransferase involved in cell wall biosynthesis